MFSDPEIILESDISSELDESIRKQLIRCFPQTADIFSRTRYYQNSAPSFTVLIKHNDIPSAHLGVVRRKITIKNQEYFTAGIQNVFVIPEFRGCGLSDAVLQTAMKKAATQDFDFGLLFTSETIAKVYAKNGWLKVSNSNFYFEFNGELKRKPEESIKMYYPLKVMHFPPGDVYLNGGAW
jgi:predicted acetyltransferase